MKKKILKIATRESPLALWQANFVKESLQKIDTSLTIELLPMKTSGDNFLNDRLQNTGGKGLFIKELEEAMLTHQADIAVHSMKDVPAFLPQGLEIAAICKRETANDAFLSEKYLNINSLPFNATIGTASLRRQAQLLIIRPDLNVKLLRGNIHTRIEKMQNGDYDAIILAAAGLKRMGFTNKIKEILSDKIMLPACGQGAIGIECRQEDEDVINILSKINDPISSLCVNSERIINKALGGNCKVPLAIYCKPVDTENVVIRTKVFSCDGKIVISNDEQGSYINAFDLAQNCSDALIKKGAKNLLDLSL